jgi:cellulose synthase/poly-beta-1,6-N-acetylglucosamine synthase-like glycosyltransferase
MWAADIRIHLNNMRREDAFSPYGHKSLSSAAYRGVQKLIQRLPGRDCPRRELGQGRGPFRKRTTAWSRFSYFSFFTHCLLSQLFTFSFFNYFFFIFFIISSYTFHTKMTVIMSIKCYSL